jgi:hypothetical protein
MKLNSGVPHLKFLILAPLLALTHSTYTLSHTTVYPYYTLSAAFLYDASRAGNSSTTVLEGDALTTATSTDLKLAPVHACMQVSNNFVH